MRRWLAFVGRRVAGLLALGAGLGALVSTVELAFAAVLQAFLVAIGALPAASATWLPPSAAVGALVAVGLVRSALVWAQVYTQGAAAEELKFTLRMRLVERTLNSRSASSSQAMALFAAGAEAAGGFAGSMQALAIQVVSALMLTASLFAVSPKLSLVAGLALAALALPLRLADRRTKVSGAGVAEEWQRASEHVLTGIRNLILLQIYGTQQQEVEKAHASLRSYRKHVLFYYFVSGFKAAAPQAAGLALVAVIATVYRRAVPLSPAALVGFIYLFLRLVQTVATAGQAVTTALMNWPQVRRWMDGIDQFEAAEPALPGPRPARVGWKLSGVRFSYGPQARLLDGLDLAIEPGSALFITGPSGSGKSTLLLLLLGSLRPESGSLSVSLDGRLVPIAEGRGALLSAVGYVGADTFLVDGTVAENLAYGLGRQPSREQMLAALERARLTTDLDRRLTEQGQGLSAGQKQRLALARALLREPAVLVLDEATSNLDLETEERIIDTLANLKGSLTLIAVTHRPSMLRLADKTVRLGEENEAILSGRP